MNYDLVLHVDDFDEKRLNLALTNAENYYAALPGEKFSLVLLLNGPAVQFFKGEFPATQKRAEVLTEKGMKIFVCANALKTFSVDMKSLWKGCTIISAGIPELVKLQKNGYAYIKP